FSLCDRSFCSINCIVIEHLEVVFDFITGAQVKFFQVPNMIKLLGVYILIKRYRNTYRFTQSGCIFRLNKSVHKVQSAKAVIVLDLSNKIVHTAIEAIAFLFSLYGWVS